MPFKREEASPEGGGLAKTLTEVHQIHPDIVSVNSIFSVNGCIHDTHIKFLLDSGAAISIVNYNIVRDAPITPIHTRAISANGSPLDVIGETVADIILGDRPYSESKICCCQKSYSRLLTWSRFFAGTWRCPGLLQSHLVNWNGF